MDFPILIILICLGESIRMKRVKAPTKHEICSLNRYIGERFQVYSRIQDFDSLNRKLFFSGEITYQKRSVVPYLIARYTLSVENWKM